MREYGKRRKSMRLVQRRGYDSGKHRRAQRRLKKTVVSAVSQLIEVFLGESVVVADFVQDRYADLLA
jgi:hypothetical protein